MNIRVVLLVVSLVVHAGAGTVAGAGGGGRRRRPGPAEDEWYTPGISGSLYVEEHPYMSATSKMQGWIEDVRDKETDELEDYPSNPMLKQQFLDKKPASWLLPLLFGRETERTNLAFRSDNLYLSAFTNGEGQWFSFKTGKGEYQIPRSTVLSFRSNYRDLVAGGVGTEGRAWQYLVGLEIGRGAVLDAVQVVNGYNPLTTPDAVIKLAIATLIVVFMEAQRLPYIRQLVLEAWENEDGGTLDARGAEMVVHWKRISCAVRIWDSYMKLGEGSIWNSTEAMELKQDPPVGLNINTPEEARAAIGPVLNSEDCSY